MRHDGEQEQGHDVCDLDHRVHGRACGVLVGVTHSVTGHRRFVRLATLLVLHTVLVDETIFKDLANSKSPTTPLDILQDWSDWLQSSPVNAVDLINRLMVAGFLLLAMAMGLTYLHLRNGGDLPGVEVVEHPE